MMTTPHPAPLSWMILSLIGLVFAAACGEAKLDDASKNDPAGTNGKGSQTVAPPKVTEGHFETAAYKTQYKGKPFDLDYLLFLPRDYDRAAAGKDAKKYPLILFLHGGGECGKDVNELKTKHLPVVLRDKPDFPAIVVSPQCPKGSHWSPELLEEVDGMLAQVIKQYRVDPDRVYLTGLSMGGFGTWEMLPLHPERFAAFVSVCGGRVGKGLEKAADLPGWAFHGEEDTIVPIRCSKEAVEAFRKAGGKVQFTPLPGVMHDAWVPAYETDPAAFEFLLKKRRGQKGDVVEITPETKAFFEAWRVMEAYRRHVKLNPMTLREGEAKFTITRENTGRLPVTEWIEWSQPTGWSVTPAVKMITVKPGQSVTCEFTGRFSGKMKDMAKTPEAASTLQISQNGRNFYRQFSNKLPLNDAAYFARKTPVYKAQKLAAPPVIDGKIDEAAWAKIPALSPLQHPYAKRQAPFKTEVKIAYDDTHLYLLAVCGEPNPQGMKRRYKNAPRDQHVYRDDNIAIFLQPPGMKKDSEYYHIIVNPNAAVMDSIVHTRQWHAGADPKVTVNAADWTVEYAIPFKAMNLAAPPTGQTWGLQFERIRTQEPDAEDRSVQWTPAFGWGHQPTRFGKLKFE